MASSREASGQAAPRGGEAFLSHEPAISAKSLVSLAANSSRQAP
jgi:hypothetical protein